REGEAPERPAVRARGPAAQRHRRGVGGVSRGVAEPGGAHVRGTLRRRPRPATSRQRDLGEPGYWDSTHLTSVLRSASLAATFGCFLPSPSSLTRFASASALPLFFAATSLKAGPTFLVFTSWHPMQPLFFARSSEASPRPAAARPRAALATTTIAFLMLPPG